MATDLKHMQKVCRVAVMGHVLLCYAVIPVMCKYGIGGTQCCMLIWPEVMAALSAGARERLDQVEPDPALVQSWWQPVAGSQAPPLAGERSCTPPCPLLSDIYTTQKTAFYV